MDFNIIIKGYGISELELPSKSMTISGELPIILDGGIKYSENVLDIADIITLEIDDDNKPYWSFCDKNGNDERDIITLVGNITRTNFTPIYLKLLSAFSPVTTLKIIISGIKKIDAC